MILRRFVFIALFVVLLGSCSAQHSENSDVYQALFASLDKAERTFYIREEPATLSSEELSEDTKTLYSSFRFPKSGKKLNAGNFGSINVKFISKDEYSKLFATGCKSGWSQFHKRYSNAKSLIQVSDIGFRSNNTEALVHVTGGSGCLAGSGYLMLLKKKSDGWSLVQEFNLWVA